MDQIEHRIACARDAGKMSRWLVLKSQKALTATMVARHG